MALPKYFELQSPALELLSNGEAWTSHIMEGPLAEKFGLTEDEVNQMYESGNGPVFKDRIQWALSYLNMAGLILKPKRGLYMINDVGREILKKPNEINKFIDEQIEKRELTRIRRTPKKKESQEIDSGDLTPEESLYESFLGIKRNIYREILDTILSKTPREFENLVVKLLQKMGYGEMVENSGIVTQYVNDKGIDGIIKEDILGFGRIHIQAKRYKYENNVPREDIQKFVGALAVAQSEKGVFITTSDFTKGAYGYVESLNASTKVVLINGDKLAEYIYHHNLGVQTEKVFEIKKLDGDFWDTMQDEQ